MTEQGNIDAVIELGEGFKGEVIAPGDLGYDDARAVWNGSIDKRPALIVRPTGAADVIDAVNYARAEGVPLAVRCGGHSVAGNGTVDGGVLVDLSSLKGVHVDPAARTARVNGGVLVGELDRETQLFGLATPSGRVTTTGVGGFTLGGGYGWLSPKFGLACDNLLSADVVTADGRLVTASEDENDDLLWGLRGGSGNFGVVTSYEFRLHPLGPTVLAGLLIHPIDEATSLIRASRDYVESAPEELVTATGILQAPPAEFIPAHLHGKPVLGVFVLYIGHARRGSGPSSLPSRSSDRRRSTWSAPMPYAAFQAMNDPFAPPGMLNYHRGIHLGGLPDEAIDAYVNLGTEIAQVSSPTTQAILFRHGGAVSRIPRTPPPPAIATPRTWPTRSRPGRTRHRPSCTWTGSGDSPKRWPRSPPEAST